MKKLLAGLCLAIFALNLGAAEPALDAILARMDQAAPGFRSMTADVEMTEYQKIIDDRTTDKGSLQMQKGKDVRAVLTFPDRVIAFQGKIIRVYWPKLNTYQDYSIGKNTTVLNQFLLLGFGASGKELAQSYNITLDNSEKVAGRDTSKLTLIPKDPKVQERLTKVDVWIPFDGANPVQQQFYEPSGNWRKVTYSNIVLNPPISGTLEMKLPPGVKKQG